MTAALPSVFLVLFAVLGTKDYLAWNRTRWRALNDLLASRKVTPEEVDGGFEFNAWYLYGAPYKQEPGKSWWWVRGGTYLLAFGELPNRKVVEEHLFKHWLPPYTGRILILKKEAPATNNAEYITPANNALPTAPTGPRP